MTNTKEEIITLLRNSSTSYKYFFLLGCIESLENNKKEYTFSELSKYMVSEALVYGDFATERYTKTDRLYDFIIYLVSLDSQFVLIKSFDKLIRLLDNYEIQNVYIENRLKELVLYVPYRLIVNNELAKLIKGKKDCTKNKIIEFLSKNLETIYIIENKKILWRDKYYNYIMANKDTLKSDIIDLLNKKFKKR